MTATPAELTDALTTWLWEQAFARDQITLAGETFTVLTDPADYDPLGGAAPDLILLRREPDGAVFEAWTQGGMLPRRMPLAPVEVAL